MQEERKRGNSPDGLVVRPAEPGDFDEILRLNEESVHFLSPLTREKLEHLHDEAETHKVIVGSDGKVYAFCLTFREGADYDSVNYRWFSDRYKNFLYVDRVVVDVNHQASGLGRLLYDDVFMHAKETGVPMVTAEIDIEPPNPVSLKFHRRYGFREVGVQKVAGGKKSVSLQISEIQKD